MQYKLIIGLGNQGKDYANTYHNVGFMALDALIEKVRETQGVSDFRRYKDLFEYAKAGGTVFVRSLVFMNESGRAIKEAARAFEAMPENILVMHDESDLTLGELKITSGQNAAGHHGVESIIAALGSKDFARARIGIREETQGPRKKASDFVLVPISAKNKEVLEKVFASLSAQLVEGGR